VIGARILRTLAPLLVALGAAPVLTAHAETPAERAAQRLLASQRGVRDDLLGLYVYDVKMGDKTVGAASVEVGRVACDGGECYRLETSESYNPRGAAVLRRAVAVVRPDLTVEIASEVRLYRHDITTRTTAIRQSDGDHRESQAAGDSKATIEYRCGDASLHEAATFLAMLLVGSAKPKIYEFETCWGAEEPTPTAFEFGERREVSVAGELRTLQAAEMIIVRPRPVGFLAPPPNPPVLEEELWFDPDRGHPVIWNRQDEAGPLRFELRVDDDQPVTVGSTIEEACALRRPQDPALCYLMAGASGQLELALEAVDLSRYAAYALANVPGLQASITAQSSIFGPDEARDLVQGNLSQLERPDTEVAIPLSAESFTSVEQAEDRVVLAPHPARVHLPDVEAKRFCVERDAASDRWHLVYVGREPLRSP